MRSILLTVGFTLLMTSPLCADFTDKSWTEDVVGSALAVSKFQAIRWAKYDARKKAERYDIKCDIQEGEYSFKFTRIYCPFPGGPWSCRANATITCSNIPEDF